MSNPANGSVTFNSMNNENGDFNFGTEAVYNCNTGFSLVGGNNTRICTGDGSSTTGAFNGVALTCEGEF